MPISLLVAQVRLRKRLDLARFAEQAVDGVPKLIVATWTQDAFCRRSDGLTGRGPMCAHDLRQDRTSDPDQFASP